MKRCAAHSRGNRHRYVVAGLWIVSATLGVCHKPLWGQDGEALYRQHCAGCHETGSGESRAPSREVLRQLSPERILNVLETGLMQRQGSQRTLAERRALADYLSDKPFGEEPLHPMPPSAFCSNSGAGEAFRNPLSGLSWMGWGNSLTNSRYQAAAAAGITAEQVPQLKLKWAFGFPDDISVSAQPVIAGGRVYIGSLARRVYSLDSRTGCVHWVIKTDSGIRSAVSIGKTAEGYAAYFGDLAANYYAVDSATGRQLWKVKVENNPVARITGSAQLYEGRLYVPVASGEESASVNPQYECCKFRGSLAVLDAATGRQVWKTYTIREEPKPRGKNKVGVQQWGPAGVGVWSAPTIDPKRNAVYVGVGNSYSHPEAPTSDSIMAFDLRTGRILWSQQVTPNDVWNTSCNVGDHTNCPDDDAPDFDFGSSPILVELQNGKSTLVAGQKSGVVYGLDPDQRGKILWQQRAGKGSTQGGIEWGMSADGANVYAAVADLVRYSDGTPNPNFGGGISALDLNTGEKLWNTPVPSGSCEGRRLCSPAQSQAVTVIPGVVFSGSWDGHLRAYSAQDGKILWDYDAMREYKTVNGVTAKGGSFGAAGPAVGGGMLFVNSGYGRFSMPGNVLLAFSVDGE